MLTNKVQEIQGLYGLFTISERVLQKIWLNGDFHQQDLRTSSGKRLKIIHPGKWNLNEGPDFKEAHLEIDGVEQIGDVEIHFKLSDWFAHGHDSDTNFQKVILHVLLTEKNPPFHRQGAPTESISLLPLMNRDLEDYAMEDALLDLEQINRPSWFIRLMNMPLDERKQHIHNLSKQRWKQKLTFAQKRLERTTWSEACHESALEVLGYSRNRVPMNRIASKYPIEAFAQNFDPETTFDGERKSWKLSGVRPANHPKLRLKQYSNICRHNPQWPEKFIDMLVQIENNQASDPRTFRQINRTKELHIALSEQIFCSQVGEKRLNTLLCDALIPLACLKSELCFEHYWQYWYPGDYPTGLLQALKQLALSDSKTPLTNGLCQGLLRLIIDAKTI